MIDSSVQRFLRERYNPDGSMLRKIQMKQLEILSEVDLICNRNGITYWIDSGTLLGAVRHGGFIPWDDDLDICILRKDYRRFCKCMRTSLNSPYRLYCIDGDCSGYTHKWPRIVNEKAHVVRLMPDGCERRENLWVDAFLMCNGKPSYVRRLDRLYGRCFRRKHCIIDDGAVNKVLGTFLYPFVSSAVYISRAVACIIHPDIFVHDYASGYYSERRKADIFPLAHISFEGKLFPSPANPDAYLKRIYGDYMSLPEEGMRESHNIIGFELE